MKKIFNKLFKNKSNEEIPKDSDVIFFRGKPILKRIFLDQEFIIPEVDGTQTFKKNTSDLSNLGKDYLIASALTTKIAIYHLQDENSLDDLSFEELYLAINPDLKQISLTQHQVIEFANLYKDFVYSLNPYHISCLVPTATEFRNINLFGYYFGNVLYGLREHSLKDWGCIQKKSSRWKYFIIPI